MVRHRVTFDRGELLLKTPNTWQINIESTKPELRVSFDIPGGCGYEITASRSLIVAGQSEAEDVVSLLRNLHSTFGARARIAYPGYRSDPPARSFFPLAPGLMTTFDAGGPPQSKRGVRYTTIAAGMVWSIVATSPMDSWRKMRPVIGSVNRQMRIEQETPSTWL